MTTKHQQLQWRDRDGDVFEITTHFARDLVPGALAMLSVDDDNGGASVYVTRENAAQLAAFLLDLLAEEVRAAA